MKNGKGSPNCIITALDVLTIEFLCYWKKNLKNLRLLKKFGIVPIPVHAYSELHKCTSECKLSSHFLFPKTLTTNTHVDVQAQFITFNQVPTSPKCIWGTFIIKCKTNGSVTSWLYKSDSKLNSVCGPYCHFLFLTWAWNRKYVKQAICFLESDS